MKQRLFATVLFTVLFFTACDLNYHQTIPYKKVVQLMIDNGWDGYLLSEYEGKNKDNMFHVQTQLRRHHVMLKNLIGY